MSRCGLNSSGNGNPNGFHTSNNPNQVGQEHCVICHLVFNNIEALINHYDTHTRGEELVNLLNNNMQAAAAPPQAPHRRLAFALGHPSRHLLPPSFTAPEVPPIAVRTTTHSTVIQQRQIQRPVVPRTVRRRLNLGPRNNNNGNMIRPARARARAAAAQRNQPAAPVPEVIDLQFGDEGNNTTDGSINLDLTLGR